mmetsp:Transcript_15324/g.17518  ORF Transcript_15324/g.17518 Transcript_15324/m.17518 type:complete len:91 (-) Transcript_15324:76-348(-)
MQQPMQHHHQQHQQQQQPRPMQQHHQQQHKLKEKFEFVHTGIQKKVGKYVPYILKGLNKALDQIELEDSRDIQNVEKIQNPKFTMGRSIQ